MNKFHTMKFMMFLVMVLGLTGCWDDRSDNLGIVGVPYTSLAIDPASCTCFQDDPPDESSILCPSDDSDPVPDRTTCDVIYAGTDGAGIFKTEDGGSKWRFLNNLLAPRVTAVAVDPHPEVDPDPEAAAPRIVYAGTEDGGIKRSIDGGDTWIGQAGTIITSVSDIVVDLNFCITGNPPCRVIYAASQGEGVWKSLDAGGSWEKMPSDTDTGLIEQTVTSLALSPKGFSTKVYAGTEGGRVYRFDTAGGKTWTEGETFTAPLLEEILSLAVHPTAQQILYAGLSGGEGGFGAGGVFRSINDGVNWGPVDIPTSNPDSVFVLAFVLQPNPFTGPTVVTYASVFGLSRCETTSCLDATDWQPPIDIGRAQGITALAIDPYAHTTMFVGTFNGELFRSPDGGSSWEKLTVTF